MIGFIVGYLIIINCIAMIFMYADMKTGFKKLEKGTVKFIYIIISIIGGSIGILVTSQMFGYKRDEKLIKRGIPFIIFIEVLIIIYIIAKKYELFELI